MTANLQTTIPFQHLTHPISRPSCWAYPDMLEVGNFGYGNFEHPWAIRESRTHFGAWCVVSSPLILGLDLLDKARVDSVWDIISNREAIAINQAWYGHPGRLVRNDTEGNYQVWAKVLANRTQAVFIMNKGREAVVDVKVSLEELGFPEGVTCWGRDVWARRDMLEPFKSYLEVTALVPHDSRFLVLTPAESLG